MAVAKDAIADDLRRKIQSGSLRAGTKVPSTRELANAYGAARGTAADAVRLLADEGLVSIKARSVAVVADPEDPRTPSRLVAEAREELESLHADAKAARVQLEQLEHRVAAALERLHS